MFSKKHYVYILGYRIMYHGQVQTQTKVKLAFEINDVTWGCSGTSCNGGDGDGIEVKKTEIMA
jgi:hypothetical protein